MIKYSNFTYIHLIVQYLKFHYLQNLRFIDFNDFSVYQPFRAQKQTYFLLVLI